MRENDQYTTPTFAATLLMLGLTACLSGCANILFERDEDQALRQELLRSNRAYLDAVAAGPVIDISRVESDVESELSDDRRHQLDSMSGPAAYASDPLTLGEDLLNLGAKSVPLSLREAIRLAVRNNLAVKSARLIPAISDARITQAEATFDATYFTNLDLQKLDTPQPASLGGLGVFGTVQSDDRSVTAGIRKPLTSGGDVTVSTTFARNFRNPSFFAVNSFYDTDILVSVNQPLLRNFGVDVNRAQIQLAVNSKKQSIETLHDTIARVVLATEQTYWNLVSSRRLLLVQQRLLERTVFDRDQLKRRRNFDVSPVRLTEANSFVELRRADVIRARQQVRLISDQLKQLIYTPDLPLAGETMIEPVDDTSEPLIRFSLVDAISTALKHRPDLRQALLQIEDASIRQRLADNQRLPVLNLAAAVQYNSVGNDLAENISDTEFIDYIVGLQFEVPIGNRGPESVHTEARLNRRTAILNYRQQAEQVVLEVKDALRNLRTAYELIGASRAARRAAADNLRALEEQEEAGVALTPEFLLDLKLSTQQRLANAELQEIQSLADYNNTIARFFLTTGTLLKRNGIEFSATPTPD